MHFGNMPRDGGHLILSEDEVDDFIKLNPLSKQWIHPYTGAYEFLNRKKRYCLWLIGADLSEVRKCRGVVDRINKVKEFRLGSDAASTRKFAQTPMIFCQIAQPDSNYLLVPRVSSEGRRYIPMGFMSKEVIANDQVQIVPHATLFHFGVLTSNVHMAWMRTVAGRLKSDYRYSKNIVYNNFPWPDPTPAQKARIEKTAQGILDARKLYPNDSLAALYDDLTMPVELRKAHQENDKAVMDAYGFNWRTMTEPECVQELMKMYVKLTEAENARQGKVTKYKKPKTESTAYPMAAEHSATYGKKE